MVITTRPAFCSIDLPWPASWMSQGHEFLITLAPALPQKLQALLGIAFPNVEIILGYPGIPHFLINTSICFVSHCTLHIDKYIYIH